MGMAIKYGWLIKGQELLFEFLKKYSSKLMELDWIVILEGFMIFICALYIIKIKFVVTLSTAILGCVCYLLIDLLQTPVEEVGKKYRVFIKKLKDKFMEQNRIVHEANKVLLIEQNELLNRTNLLAKQLETITEEKNGLKQKMDKLVEDERKKVSLLEEKCVALSECMRSERIAYKTWKKQETSYRKKLEQENAVLKSVRDQEITMRADLEKDLEDEIAEKDQEIVEKERIQEEKENLEKVLKEEREEKDRLEKEVQKYKAMVDETNEIIKYLQQDRDRNLNLKQVKEEMWDVIKSEIEKNARCLSNELGQLRESLEKTERTEVLNAEERCDMLKGHLKKMLKQLEKLEKERDNLVEENRVLSDKAKEDLENSLLNKLEGVMDMLSAQIVTYERKTEKMLENQDSLFNLLNVSKHPTEGEVSSDDDYEVVEGNLGDL